MDIDALTGELETVLGRARAVLNGDITAAKKTVAGLNAEKASTQAAIAQLSEQRAKAQTQLDETLANLHRGSTLASLDGEIKAVRKELEVAKAETEKLSLTLTGLRKQQRDEEHKLVALQNETQRLLAIRSESEVAMADIRQKLRQIPIGQQS